jgi:hypothetical protein
LNTSFNYRSRNRDYGEKIGNNIPSYSIRTGFKQSHTARLVFSCVGYIEWYRRYMIEGIELDDMQLSDINKSLITKITKLLDIYRDSPPYLKTKRQDNAEKTLRSSISVIIRNFYSDKVTSIETSD